MATITKTFFFGSMMILIIGCAPSVRVSKVPTPSQYIEWTDDMQKKSDKMEGVRYYLPRPFVNVFESFPVRTDIGIAQGIVSPDGKYLLITSLKPNTPIGEVLVGAEEFPMSNGGISVPLSQIKNLDKALKHEVTMQSKALEGAKKIQNLADSTTSSSTASQSSSATQQQKTGINEVSMKNDNGAYAYQPMRGNFDIAYMPDFEEQYVVSSKAGLGNAKVEINLGQGWSLQGFNSITDNSALNSRIFDLIDSSIKAAKGAAGTASKAGGFPITFESAVLKGASEKEPVEVKAFPGTPVSIRLVIVHYAAKGLYPVLKPREIQKRKIEDKDIRNFFLVNIFNPSARSKKVSTLSEIDEASLAESQYQIERKGLSTVIPRYPYQFISFNTFKYISVEAITPQSPFGELYDKTGTKGDAGDREKGIFLPNTDAVPGNNGEDRPSAPGANEAGVNSQELSSVEVSSLVEQFKKGNGDEHKSDLLKKFEASLSENKFALTYKKDLPPLDTPKKKEAEEQVQKDFPVWLLKGVNQSRIVIPIVKFE